MLGSRPLVADSRGEPEQPGDGAALHSGLVVRPTPLLARDPVANSKRALDVEGDLIAHDVEARAGELVRDGLDRHDAVGAGVLAFIEPLHGAIVAPREVRGLDKRPAQVAVAGAALTFTLALVI